MPGNGGGTGDTCLMTHHHLLSCTVRGSLSIRPTDQPTTKVTTNCPPNSVCAKRPGGRPPSRGTRRFPAAHRLPPNGGGDTLAARLPATRYLASRPTSCGPIFCRPCNFLLFGQKALITGTQSTKTTKELVKLKPVPDI